MNRTIQMKAMPRSKPNRHSAQLAVADELRANERPTPNQANAYQAMFDHFNRELFDGTLPHVILNFSRKAKTLGYFAPSRWVDTGGGEKVLHEISLNPQYLIDREPRDVAATFAHELAHLWQAEQGAPSRSGYHNKEWADKMEAIGLMPSNTGEAGGARVGERMSHYIVEGGRFARAYRTLPKAARLPWHCVEREDTEARRRRLGLGPRNKVKYTCPRCETNVWGKPDLRIRCDECEVAFDQMC